MPITRELISTSKLLSCVTPTAGAAGTTAINGSIIDSKDFSGLLFMVHFGAIVALAVTSIKLQAGAQPNLSDAADIAGTNQVVADTADDTLFYIDIVNPTFRYWRLVVSRATQNATVQASVLLYGGRGAPATQVAAGETWLSPAAGTA